ncbi:MAG: DUF1566 domain-containing protein [Burkholderiales bacterium]|nr:DUF1566 domain-containing protein [Burkholderiales bacterium]
MHRPLLARSALPAIGIALATLLAGPAQAALQDRDLDGNGVTDAFYDTDLDITWLRDANVNGPMDWHAAASWADGFSIGGYGDWRLPTSTLGCHFEYCNSEMRHLWSVELGNSAGALTNTGAFQNLLPAIYWTGTDYPSGNAADVFDQSNGAHGWSTKIPTLYAMAVRDGDIPVVPEPGTYALMLAGLAGLMLRRRVAERG